MFDHLSTRLLLLVRRCIGVKNVNVETFNYWITKILVFHFLLKNDLLKVKKYRPITSLLGKQKGVTNLMNTNKILLNTKMFINQ